MVNGSLSVQPTTVAKTCVLKNVSVGKGKRAVIFYLQSYRVRTLHYPFVPKSIVSDQLSDFLPIETVASVLVSFPHETFPKLVLCDGARAGGKQG